MEKTEKIKKMEKIKIITQRGEFIKFSNGDKEVEGFVKVKLPQYFLCENFTIEGKTIHFHGLDKNYFIDFFKKNNLKIKKGIIVDFEKLYPKAQLEHLITLYKELLKLSEKDKISYNQIIEKGYYFKKQSFSDIAKPFFFKEDGSLEIKMIKVICNIFEKSIIWEQRNHINKALFYNKVLSFFSNSFSKDEIDKCLLNLMNILYTVNDTDIIFYNYYEIEKENIDIIKNFKAFDSQELKVVSEFEITNGQQQAINAISSCPDGGAVMINGYAGTGKTTAVAVLSDNAIIPLRKVYAFAPTSSAVDIINEKTIFSAMTIHSLIFRSQEEYSSKLMEELEEVEYFIIDEFSMIDIGLFNKFIKSLKLLNKDINKIKLIFIGDIGQLPPVEYGSIMKDCLSIPSNLKIITLNEVVRQKANSCMLFVANAFRAQEHYNYNIQTEDCEINFVSINNEIIKKTIIECYEKSLITNQIISPMNKLNQEINRLSQEILIKDKTKYYKKGYSLFYPKDKIIININTSFELSNGTQAIISTIKDEKIFFKTKMNEEYVALESCDCFDEKCSFDERGYCDLNDKKNISIKYISLGYSITIHKSQGATFEKTFFLGDNQGKIMYTNELIYTTLTRSSKKLVLYANYNFFLNALRTKSLASIDNYIQHIVT